MKSLFLNYFRSDFNLRTHLWVMAFWLACLALNYRFDIEDGIIDPFRDRPVYYLLFFLFYALAYFGAALIVIFHQKDWAWLHNRTFWIVGAAGIAILAFDIGFYWDDDLVRLFFSNQSLLFVHRCFDRFVSLFTNVLPLFVLWKVTQQPQNHFYGLTFKGGSLRPYALMILLMIPLLLWASFQPDFLRQYPTYRSFGVHFIWETPEWVTILLYEICYGIDFISIELFFRGFLVLGIGAIIGKKAILPMAVVYSFIHFGKPMGEAISSFFGGYILGIIAFYTRNIFGGLIVHLGIAWLMELFAFWQLIKH